MQHWTSAKVLLISFSLFFNEPQQNHGNGLIKASDRLTLPAGSLIINFLWGGKSVLCEVFEVVMVYKNTIFKQFKSGNDFSQVGLNIVKNRVKSI